MNFKLSPSDLTYLYEGCKFCFWLKVRRGIPQPSMPMPGIFTAIAARQKEFYADRRTEAFCPVLPPGKVILGEQWVESQALTGPDGHSCYIKGKFDVVLEFDDGSYGIIDFKTASPTEKKADLYARQLHAYTYALEHPGMGALHLTPVTKLGLIFFEPDAFEQQNFERQLFSGRAVWVEVARNDDSFIRFITEVMRLLGSEHPPEPSTDCAWCGYRDKTKNLASTGTGPRPVPDTTDQSSGAPLCPQCSGPMTLKKGRYGEFWSCRRFPECRGTRRK